MAQLLDQYLEQFLTFVLVLTRIGGLIMTAPIFGSRSAPARIRAMLAVAMAMLITPVFWNGHFEAPGNLVSLAGLMAREALLGIAIGLAVLILLAGLQVTGQIISQMGGMSLADVFDPGYDTNIPVLSQLLDLMATAVFFAIGGHRWVISALLDSFEWMPPGGGNFPPTVVEALTEITSQSFSIGIRAAAPVMLALFLAIVITGIISRALPQLNVMSVGFNINALVLLGVLSLTLGAAGWVLQEEAEQIISQLRDSLR